MKIETSSRFRLILRWFDFLNQKKNVFVESAHFYRYVTQLNNFILYWNVHKSIQSKEMKSFYSNCYRKCFVIDTFVI